jgi:predicted HD phosphohydrolase
MTAATAQRSPLANADWQYIEKPSLDDFGAEDWTVLSRQRRPFYRERQAAHVLDLLLVSEHDPSFGYKINNFRHCLQSATLVLQAGLDEETVVVALLHDIGFVACPANHGDFSAALLGNYISPRNYWMLRHHQIFQQVHLHDYPGAEPAARDRYRGAPHFEWTAEFVAKFDQNAIDDGFPVPDLDFFAPMVKRLFARSPQPIPAESQAPA